MVAHEYASTLACHPPAAAVVLPFFASPMLDHDFSSRRPRRLSLFLRFLGIIRRRSNKCPPDIMSMTPFSLIVLFWGGLHVFGQQHSPCSSLRGKKAKRGNCFWACMCTISLLNEMRCFIPQGVLASRWWFRLTSNSHRAA